VSTLAKNNLKARFSEHIASGGRAFSCTNAATVQAFCVSARLGLNRVQALAVKVNSADAPMPRKALGAAAL